ncbi:MAG: YihY/virulence factor BrkB family protein [Nevskiaceae bacterium]|nr:MAG: YihY/virulence factor BrkB family protein [Nevskiaceae bacterium]TBR75114.1 MAG: YihY/virulence factor BrkB family protein [Nevskiaceae bacterium]
MKQSLFDRLQRSLSRHEPRHAALRPGWMAARCATALARDIVEGELNLWAMSLVYTTLLSLVPLLALAFSLLKAFGVHRGLEELLTRLLAPLGPDAAAIAARMTGFVDNVKVGVLGAVGVGFLLYAAVSMIYKVESSFNYLWEVEGRARRIQRFGEYISVLVIGPFVLFSALGITASLKNQHLLGQILASGPFGDGLVLLSKLATYLLMVMVFVFIYSFMPNIRVRLKSALVGGLFTGVAWQTASVAFASFVSGASNYNAIYSGFAILVFLLLWIYVGWLIVLVGCRLSFYVQFPERLVPVPDDTDTSLRDREMLALAVYAAIARRFLAGQPPSTSAALRMVLHTDENSLRVALAPLLDQHLVVETATPGEFVPGRDPGSLSVAAVWQCIRGTPTPPPGDPAAGAASRFITDVEQRAAADTTTVCAWLETQPALVASGKR